MLQEYKYGIVAVDKKGRVLHFVGYKEKPTKDDYKALDVELQTDRSLGLFNKKYKLEPASEREINLLKKEFSN